MVPSASSGGLRVFLTRQVPIRITIGQPRPMRSWLPPVMLARARAGWEDCPVSATLTRLGGEHEVDGVFGRMAISARRARASPARCPGRSHRPPRRG